MGPAQRKKKFGLRFALVATCFAWQASVTGQELPASAVPPEVPKLIEQLGDRDFALRERASDTLKQKPKAIPALRAALRSEDAEIRRRSKEVLEELRAKQTRSALEKMRRAKQEGKIDLFVEFATSLRQELGDENGLLYDLIQGTNQDKKLQSFSISRGFPASAFQYTPCVSLERYSYSKVDQYHCAVVTSASAELISDRGVIARDGVSATDELGVAIVLSNGNVAVTGQGTRIWNSIVVCDGDVDVDRIQWSLVIARGRVKCKRNDDSLIIDGERAALGKLSFFELADVGLEVTDEQPLEVKSVKKGSAFARCGVQVGDRLLTANGNKVNTANEFRRLVRRLLAESSLEPKSLPIQVERAGQKLNLSLECECPP